MDIFVVISCTQINHHVLIPEEEHSGACCNKNLVKSSNSVRAYIFTKLHGLNYVLEDTTER